MLASNYGFDAMILQFIFDQMDDPYVGMTIDSLHGSAALVNEMVRSSGAVKCTHIIGEGLCSNSVQVSNSENGEQLEPSDLIRFFLRPRSCAVIPPLTALSKKKSNRDTPADLSATTWLLLQPPQGAPTLPTQP